MSFIHPTDHMYDALHERIKRSEKHAAQAGRISIFTVLKKDSIRIKRKLYTAEKRGLHELDIIREGDTSIL